MLKVPPEAPTASPAPRDQRESDPAQAARIDEWVDRVLVELAKPTPVEQAAAVRSLLAHPGVIA